MSYEHILIAMMLMFFGMAVKARSASTSDDVPKGWLKTGSHPENYEMRIDPANRHQEKASAYIKFTGKKPDGFGTLMQIFKADDYRGKCLQMSAWMKTEGTKAAQLWMRLDGARGEILGFDNMDNRKVAGTTDWKKYTIILDVPENAFNIAFGVLVGGKGQAWVSDFRFEEVSREAAAPDPPAVEYPKEPSNLDFES